MTTAAQTVGVAVLTHNNENTMFYGNKALQQAVEAATDGDVISLSPGTFEGYIGGPYNDTYFTKSGLTIIGSGMDEGPSQTIVKDFQTRADLNSDKYLKLTLKNLYSEYISTFGDGKYDLSLEKCKSKSSINCDVDNDNSSTLEMSNCVALMENSSFINFNVNAYNCVLKVAELGKEVTTNKVFTNCITLINPIGNGSFNNSVFLYGQGSLSSSIRATNCKAIGSNSNFFGIQAFGNESLGSDFEAFVEGSFYELKPELTSTWVDENGEQIGIYGGPEPFSALPDAPRFTKFNVPTRTDADGKLPVKIEITMPEK